MKICYFGHGIQDIGGGSSEYFTLLANGTARSGNDVTVVSSGKRRADLAPEVKFVGLSRGNSRLEKIVIFPLRAALFFLFNRGFDLMHAGSSYRKFAYLCKAVSLLSRLPVVYSVFSDESLKNVTFNTLIFTSKRLAGSIEKPGVYIPTFVDAGDFLRPSKYSYGDGNGVVVGTMGTPLNRRGHMVLLKAIPLVLERYPDTLFVLAVAITPQIYRKKEGLGLQRIKEFIARHDLQDNVHIIGKVDVPAFFSSIDLFVYPLETAVGALDITPTVLECLAAGCCIITSKAGANEEIIRDGHNGFLVDRQDPEEYAKRIIEAIENSEALPRIRENAKNTIGQFSIDHVLPLMLSAYDQFKRS
jgi:glycosyltransferase involved in cell wall biosynthesis